MLVLLCTLQYSLQRRMTMCLLPMAGRALKELPARYGAPTLTKVGSETSIHSFGLWGEAGGAGGMSRGRANRTQADGQERNGT